MLCLEMPHIYPYYYNTKFSFVYSSYIIIQKCWKNSPDDRPTFDTLSTMFNAKIQAITISSETDMDLEPPFEGIIIYICDRQRENRAQRGVRNIEKRSINFLKMYCFKRTEGNG